MKNVVIISIIIIIFQPYKLNSNNHKIIQHSLHGLSIATWGFSRGIEEVWRIKNYPDRTDKLPLEYHAWRIIECGALVSTILTYDSEKPLYTIGLYIFTTFMIYEKTLNYYQYGDPYHSQAPQKLLQIDIPIENIHMDILGTCGSIIAIFSLKSKE